MSSVDDRGGIALRSHRTATTLNLDCNWAASYIGAYLTGVRRSGNYPDDRSFDHG